MITVIEGNIAANALISLGAVIGILGGVATTFKKLREDEPLIYTEAPFTQALNRLLFVIGCVVCLFVDFPKPDNHFIQQVYWLLFPFMGFLIFLLSWCVSFWTIIALKAIIRWIFASFIPRT